MTGSSYHELGKWLAGLLLPVLERFSSHCISDSFDFAKTMQNLDINLNVFMCSFDVSSLFTNVPLDETIKTLCDKSDLQPVVPKDVFVELMKSTTSSVDFSFDNTMCKPTSGVDMGSLPGPSLEKEVTTAVESCYGSVSACLVFTSKRMQPVVCKDVLPTTQKSFVIYEYKYH